MSAIKGQDLVDNLGKFIGHYKTFYDYAAFDLQKSEQTLNETLSQNVEKAKSYF